MTDSLGIPGYRVVRKLGQGGMATVYLAIQESFDREVALKVMSPFLNSDPSFATRFLREARIVAQIHHSSIVPVMDVGHHEVHHYLCMEYLPGGDLKQRIVAGRHGVSLALNVSVAICSALDLAHRKGFVHRDIKPENVLFREDGTPVLTDFGIARAIDTGTQLTMAGTMVGTPNYMSPEQVKGAELDGRSDLYSMGVVFYEMLTGLVPFQADSTISLAMKHLSEPLPHLPPELAHYQPFLDRLMAKDRDDRFATGAEVIRALRLISEMQTTRESTMVRAGRASQPQVTGMDMPTLVSPTGSLRYPTGSQPLETVRIPATATQPSGIMPIPLTLVAPSVRASPVVSTPLPASAVDSPDSVAAPGEPAARVPAAPPVSVPEPRAKLAPPRPPVVRKPPVWPARVRQLSQQMVQKVKKSPPWVLVASIAVIAIGTGYVLGRSTDSDAQPQVASPPPSPPATTEVATQIAAVVPSQPQPSIETPESQPPEVVPEIVPEVGDEGSILPAVLPMAVEDSGEAERAAAKKEEAERRKAEEKAKKEKREAERLARIEAQKRIEAEQRKKTEDAKAEREGAIRQLLADAREDMAKGRLWRPAENNALERYLAVLGWDSGNAEARAGISRIVTVMVQEARNQASVGNQEATRELVDRIRSLQPGHVELPILDARMAELETKRVVPSRAERASQESAQKAIKNANAQLNKEPLTFAIINTAVKEYNAAQTRAPLAPGLAPLANRIQLGIGRAAQTEFANGNRKEVQKVIDLARSQDWMTPELEQLERSMAQ